MVRVGRKTLIADGVVHLELHPTDNNALPEFAPGSHIDITLPNDLTRQYSLFRTNESESYEIAVLRDAKGRGGSRSVHEVIKENDIVCISAPRNHFPLDMDATHSILFAGGIGITPILSMSQKLAKADMNFELHYCAQSANRMAFKDYLERGHFSHNVRFYLDEDGDRLPANAILSMAPSDSHLYVCGPTGFINYILDTAYTLGWTNEKIHYEKFCNNPIDCQPNQAFTIKLAKSGVTVHVPPEKSVAEALTSAGVVVPLSCEQGVCGTCAVRIINGIPDHRDVFFSDKEKSQNEYFTPCCSRSKSPELTIDL